MKVFGPWALGPQTRPIFRFIVATYSDPTTKTSCMNRSHGHYPGKLHSRSARPTSPSPPRSVTSKLSKHFSKSLEVSSPSVGGDFSPPQKGWGEGRGFPCPPPLPPLPRGWGGWWCHGGTHWSACQWPHGHTHRACWLNPLDAVPARPEGIIFPPPQMVGSCSGDPLG